MTSPLLCRCSVYFISLLNLMIVQVSPAKALPRQNEDSTYTSRSPDFSSSTTSPQVALPQPPTPPPVNQCASSPSSGAIGYEAISYHIFSVYKQYGRSCVDIEGLNYWSALLHADLTRAYGETKVKSANVDFVRQYYPYWPYGVHGAFEEQLRANIYHASY